MDRKIFGVLLIFVIQFSLIQSLKHIPWTQLSGNGNWVAICFNNGVVELKLQGPDQVWLGVGFGSGVPPSSRMEDVPIVAYSSEFNETLPPRLNDHYSSFQGEPWIDSRYPLASYTDNWITDSDTVADGQRTLCAHRIGYTAPDPEPADKTFDPECNSQEFIWARGVEQNGLYRFLYHFPQNRGYAVVNCQQGLGLCCRTKAPTSAPTERATGHGGGDPHFITIDGLHYNYDGPCSYTLLTNKCRGKVKESIQFEIISHHAPARKKSLKVFVIKEITVLLSDENGHQQKIGLKTHNSVFVNDNKVQLPYNNSLIQVTISNTRVRGQSLDRIHLRTNFGLNFFWTNAKGASMDVYVPRKIHTCGLLGNSNGNIKDDLQLKNGTFLDTKFPLKQKIVDTMGDSWMVNMPNQPLRCSLYPEHSVSSMSQCVFDQDTVRNSCEHTLDRLFNKLTGRGVSKCFSNTDGYNAIDAKRIYDDCVTEICACKTSQKDCVPHVAISELKDACEKNGVAFPDFNWSN